MTRPHLMFTLAILCAPFAHAQSSPPATQDTPASTRIGDATHRLLAEQASGRHAGPPRPMLGVTATPAMQRYVDSYNTKIPPFFDTKVGNANNGSR